MYYVQANASREQQLKADRCNPGAAADSEADAIGEQQLELSGAAWITHVGDRGGSS